MKLEYQDLFKPFLRQYIQSPSAATLHTLDCSQVAPNRSNCHRLQPRCALRSTVYEQHCQIVTGYSHAVRCAPLFTSSTVKLSPVTATLCAAPHCLRAALSNCHRLQPRCALRSTVYEQHCQIVAGYSHAVRCAPLFTSSTVKLSPVTATLCAALHCLRAAMSIHATEHHVFSGCVRNREKHISFMICTSSATLR